jgi:tetratricopeptide (TPR) repeat protein
MLVRISAMRRALLSSCLLLALSTPFAQAAETTFGSTEAEECYREAMSPARATGTKVCTRAIEKGRLNGRDLAASYSNRGVIWSRAGEIEKAIADHNKAIELNPDSIGALINRGNAHSRDQNYHEALLDYDQAIELSGAAFAPALFNRGWVYSAINEQKTALKDFEAALKLQPDNERYERVVAETKRQIKEAKKEARRKKREEREQRKKG